MLVATTMLAAGCGGDTDTSANTPEVKGKSYADTVCALAFDWEATSTEIDGYRAGTATDDDVDLRLSPAQSGTENFITDIRGLAEPDDAAQKAAYASLQQTADALADRSQTIASDVDDLKTRAAQAQAQIELLYSDLQTSSHSSIRSTPTPASPLTSPATRTANSSTAERAGQRSRGTCRPRLLFSHCATGHVVRR